ncbi:MAG: hypothetical protein V4687_15025 [Bacteroidota bacterium]
MKAILLFLFAILSLTATAQPIIDDSPESKLPLAERRILWLKARQYKLDGLQLTVNTPPGFTEAPIFSLRSPFPGSSASYTFVNPDSTALIVVVLLRKDSAAFEKELLLSKASSTLVKHSINGMEGYHPESDPSYQWYDHPGHLNASILKPHFFTANELKRFNAESGIMYTELRKKLHLGKYKTVKNISLNKKYRGNVDIEYFIKEGSNVSLEAIIENAPEMISYK